MGRGWKDTLRRGRGEDQCEVNSYTRSFLTVQVPGHLAICICIYIPILQFQVLVIHLRHAAGDKAFEQPHFRLLAGSRKVGVVARIFQTDYLI